MRCDDARLLISADLDGEATPDEAALAAEHLAGCAECRAWRADAERLEARFAEPVPVGALPALPVAGGVPVPRRPSGSPLRPLGLAVLAAGLVTAGITGVVLVRGDGDGGPRALPSTSPTVTPAASSSPASSPTPVDSPTPEVSPTPSLATSTSPSPTPSPSTLPTSAVPSPSATASPAAQPIVATARAGILDVELRLPSARQQGRIRATLRVTNNTDRDVTYRSPGCGELVVRVDGAAAVTQPVQPCDDKEQVTHTLGPGAWHEVRLDLAASPGEHTVDGRFDGRDPEASPDPSSQPSPSASPSPAPSRVQPVSVGPVSVRVT